MNRAERAILMGKPAPSGADPTPIRRNGDGTDPIRAQAQRVELVGGRFDLRDSRFHRMIARLILGQ